MQKVLPVLLMVLALTVIALFSDRVGVTLPQRPRFAAPVDLEGGQPQQRFIEIYKLAGLDGRIPPHEGSDSASRMRPSLKWMIRWACSATS